MLISSTALQPIVAVRPHLESAESVARRVFNLGYRFGRATHVNVVAGATRSARAASDLGEGGGPPPAGRVRRGAAGRDRPAARPGRRASAAVHAVVIDPGLVTADCVLMMGRPRETFAAGIAKVKAEQQVERIAILIGLVVRDSEEAAWAATVKLFPPDRRQEVAGRLFRSQVVSSEHTRSYALAELGDVHDERLWYGAPARGIDAPKLVGSVSTVASWLASCRDLGVTDVIIDLPPDPAEYGHLGPVFGTRLSGTMPPRATCIQQD